MLRRLADSLLRPHEPKDPRSARERYLSEPAWPRRHSGLDFSDGPVQPAGDSFDASGIEALNLEPIVAPFLGRMRPTMVTREQAVAARPRRGTAGARMMEDLSRRPSAALEQAFLSPGNAAMLSHAVPLSTPQDERSNPFDDPEQNDLVITPLPRRPGLGRRSVSARGRRDMPLRIQAIRRSHQQAFAEALMRRIEADMVREEEEAQAAEQAPAPDPSALWQRRRRSSPEGVAGPAPMRLSDMPTSRAPPPLFQILTPEGTYAPYSMSRETPSPAGPSPRPQEPCSPSAAVFTDADGRTWI